MWRAMEFQYTGIVPWAGPPVESILSFAIDARPRGGNRQNNKTVEKKLKNVVVAPL
jgi:hypothetical protein